MFAQRCSVPCLVFVEKKNEKYTPHPHIPVGFKYGIKEEKRERKKRRQKGATEINLWVTQSQVIRKKRQGM